MFELRNKAFDKAVAIDSIKIQYSYLQIMDNFTLFRASVKDGTLRSPTAIYARAFEIDHALEIVFSDVPQGWLYETVHDKIPFAHEGRYDIYFDLPIAQFWNSYRTARILLHETMRRVVDQGYNADPPVFSEREYVIQCQRSMYVRTRMRDEILYSVPQHMGSVSRKPFVHTETSYEHPSPKLSPSPVPPLGGLGGCMVMWPL